MYLLICAGFCPEKEGRGLLVLTGVNKARLGWQMSCFAVTTVTACGYLQLTLVTCDANCGHFPRLPLYRIESGRGSAVHLAIDGHRSCPSCQMFICRHGSLVHPARARRAESNWAEGRVREHAPSDNVPRRR